MTLPYIREIYQNRLKFRQHPLSTLMGGIQWMKLNSKIVMQILCMAQRKKINRKACTPFVVR